MSENPFYPTRFEREQRALIWVSPLSETLMREQGAFYIAGARGSGKTSILKSLDVEEAILNESLSSQVSPDQNEYLGIYFRATDLFAQSTSDFDWSKLAPNAPNSALIEVSYISALIELTAIRLLASHLSMLRRRRRVRFTGAELDTAITNLSTALPGLFGDEEEHGGDHLDWLTARLEKVVQKLNVALLRGDSNSFFEWSQYGQQGATLRKAALALLPLAGPPHFKSSGVRLKICIDECDYLTSSQQRVLNTLVRKSAFPIEWVVAYVDTEYDPVTTSISNHPLTDADRKVIPLDDTGPQSELEFRLRCQAIVSYRLFYALSKERQDAATLGRYGTAIRDLFILADRLPNYEINELIHNSLQARVTTSVRVVRCMAEARAFRDRAYSVAKSLFQDGSEQARALLGTGAPPYVQMVVFEKLGKQLEGELKRNTKIVGASLRRKSVAAMLMLFHDLGIREIPFAGASMLLTLSDGCIRDFLEIMSAIYDQWRQETSKTPDAYNFLQPSETLLPELQRKSVEASSNAKFRGIDEARELRDDLTEANSARNFSRVISGLGKLTRAMQVSEDGKTSLRSPERGIFIVDQNVLAALERSLNSPAGSCLKVLRRLENENLLVATNERLSKRQIQKDTRVYRFRLHKRFAPLYGFSYRGALTEVRMPEVVLYELIYPSAAFVESAWVDAAMDKIGVHADQDDLFGPEL